MTTHIYEVQVTEQATVYVEADSIAKARSAALSGVKVKRLSGGEALAVVRAGKNIIDANKTADTPPQQDPLV